MTGPEIEDMEDQFQEEYEKKEAEKIKELEKLTIDELECETKRIEGKKERYNFESGKKIEAIDIAIKTRKIINIYKKEDFKGLYEYILNLEEERRKDDIPF